MRLIIVFMLLLPLSGSVAWGEARLTTLFESSEEARLAKYNAVVKESYTPGGDNNFGLDGLLFILDNTQDRRHALKNMLVTAHEFGYEECSQRKRR